MLTLILWSVLAAATLYYFGLTPLTYWKRRHVKQGYPLFFLGDSWKNLFRLESFPEMSQRLYNRFPNERYSGIYQFSTPTLLVRDLELIKRITVKDFDHFVDHRSFVSETSDPFWARNLFSLKGEKWREMRPILSPAFTSSKMRLMFGLISECAENFVEYFLEKEEDVIEVELREVFTRLTNDAIATTAFGIEVDSLRDPDNDFYVMGKNALTFNGWKRIRFFVTLFLPDFLINLFNIRFFDKPIQDFFLNLVEETIKIREEQGIVRPDMIQLLMGAKKGLYKYEEENGTVDTGFATVKESDIGKGLRHKVELTNLDIAAQALIFFFGGFDSSASLMCFMGYELAVNQDVQETLRKEIRDTHDECGGKITYEALLKMKYMDMVVSETLRKWSNGTIVERVCTKPYTIEPELPEEKPLHIKKGEIVMLPFFAIQHDPKYFPDPDRFDPERFSDENKEEINPYAYLPFGAGPRNCIGSRFALLETKIVFFYLLSKFEIVPTGESQIPLKLSRNNFNLYPEGGFWFGLKRVNK